ncbi:hypothetical protein DNH61_04585 [Paenibacillus sambharensis]|uniref:SnoaL-like domain-containing protein n=1 Tax=Paenibacillus sambharensis TaxID=1803190 RepID=A0A2W1LA96_9BACL|nr:hypothetical protein [Paenibacillus sambharensis]PZD97168.1 hypothetical protein DNH61_04585 [Paenibacillus sambharensis]
MSPYKTMLGAVLLFMLAIAPCAALPFVHADVPQKSESRSEGLMSSKEAEKAIAGVAQEAILALKNKDAKALQKLAHPDKGIRFTPYAYVDLKHDVRLSREQLSHAFKDSTVYEWGAYDGTGDPIKLTFNEYYESFIFNRDYSKSEQVGFNEAVMQGNTINNIREAYPNGVFVEYHFSKGPDGNVMGLSSLRLVFEQLAGQWYLVGIIHDEWTI